MRPLVALGLVSCCLAVSLNLYSVSAIKASQNLEDLQVINRKAACPPDCPRDCWDLYLAGNVQSGVYTIYLETANGRMVFVYCDMATTTGGWLVFQSRVNGQVDFYRNYTEYERGFGQLQGEFWLGLNNLYYVLAQKDYQLRVDMTDHETPRGSAWAEYSYFTAGSDIGKYPLGLYAYTGGTAGNSMQVCGMKFTTNDNDNDFDNDFNCAQTHSGAWWYQSCGNANLNGRWSSNTSPTNFSTRNAYWHTWKNSYYPLRSMQMKIRPIDAV